jgi:hypothetical protein
VIDQTPICKQVIPLLRLKKDSVSSGWVLMKNMVMIKKEDQDSVSNN